jgi:hypothetical protein
MATGTPPAGRASVEAKVRTAQDALFPELGGVRVAVVENADPSSFYAANVDASTLEVDPFDRTYTVVYSTVQLAEPPPHAGVIAILAHELQHIVDYTAMEAREFAEFGIWYATSDVSEYERATDERALELGCGTGLIAYRQWLYGVVDDETEAAKRRDYYTPEEIEAWMAANE